MAELGARTGRSMHVVEYAGHPEAERVLVVMGSGAETVRETVEALNEGGARVGVLQVRLYRPFPAQALVEALPAAVRRIAVLDRTKEPGSMGEPLFLDVVAALAESHADGERAVMPKVIGGRYGLSSKEFTPGMVAGVFAELGLKRPRRRFTIGIDDDVSGTSLPYDRDAGHRVARHGARGLLRPGGGRDRRRQQEHDQDPGVRGEPARPGLLRLRLQEVGLADGVAPALRAAADPGALPGGAGELRRLPSLRAARQGRRARTGGARRHAAAQLPAFPRRRLGCAVASHPGADPRQGPRGLRDRRGPDRPRGRPRGPDQRGPADLLLRHLRRAAAGGGDHPDQGGDRQDLRPARPRCGRSATTPPSTARWRGCSAWRCPRR